MHHLAKETLDLKDYEKHDKLFFNRKTKYYEIMDPITGNKNIAKIFLKTVDNCSRKHILNLYREIYINSKIKHPSFLQYKGFSFLDFKSRRRPVIVFDHISNFPLNLQIKSSLKDKSLSDKKTKIRYQIDPPKKDQYEKIHQKINIKLTPTKKLIILYGIASGMSYLHSHNILHRNLSTSSIFFDDSLLPKITGLDFSKPLVQISPLDEPKKDGKLIGDIKNLAPEILLNLEYGKASDVYSFSLLMYELMTSKLPYDDLSKKKEIIEKIGKNGNRPNIDSNIPRVYQKLIEKCWTQNPKERPTFDEIAFELRNNSEFITYEVDKEEFYEYVKFIENSTVEFDTEKTIDELDLFLKEISNQMKISKIDYNDHLPMNSNSLLDIEKYLKKGDNLNYQAIEKETNIKFHVDSCLREINTFLRYEIVNFARSVNIVSQLNHPAILKFIGYSPVDFDNMEIPICLTENYHTEECFKDDTLKLIVLYGVASGMAYLHSHNILHRNLKLESIYMNDFMLPKFYGFEIAKEINGDSTGPNKTIKGTPIYIAPEVYLNEGYSKKSDVYSYSLILYEIITNEKPYSNLLSPKEIKEKVAYEHQRPIFKKPILSCYRSLIEKCWEPNPKDRPTFEEILTELRTNPDFITDTVDKERFFEYVSYIDNYNATFEPNRRVKQLDDILENRLDSFPDFKHSVHFSNMRKTETNNLIINDDDFLNEKDFEEVSYIKEANIYSIDEFMNIKNKTNYIVETIIPPQYLFRHEIINYSRKLNILLQIYHPLFLETVGYSLDTDGQVSIFNKLYINHNNLANVLLCDKFRKELEEEEEEEEFEEENSEKKEEEYKNEQDKDYEEEENNEKEEEEEFKEDKNKKNKDNEEEDTTDDSMDSDSYLDISLNSTNKLIIIYGIAVGMAYLHSHNIIHRDLKPSNIYLNTVCKPQIAGFEIAKEINGDSTGPNKTIKGTPIYIAPEVYLNEGYSKKSDVYSYSLILYEIITNEKPYSNLLSPKEIKEKVAYEHQRPIFKKPILSCYRSLIEKCWEPNPKDRPTFEEILTELRTNPDFTKGINNEEYQNYIETLDKVENTFKSSRKIEKLDVFVKSKLYKFKEIKSKLNFNTIFETETNNVNTDYDYCDIKGFQKIKMIQENSDDTLYIIKEKKTKNLYIAKRIFEPNNRDNPERPKDLSNELNNLLKLKHPSFLKFIKYSPVYFRSKRNPVIIFENAINGTLERTLEIDRKNKGNPILNDTKKLIIIYGIASAMSYLHSLNIIHCRLRPSNIFLDDFLFPKITGFDISRNLSDNPLFSLKEITNSENFYDDDDFHNSPEIVKNLSFSSACDVFSFAVIAYQLITNELPFIDGDYFTGYRPVFKDTVPNCYKQLIDQCWAHEPEERPTFDEIVTHIKTNKEFITEKVDKEEFLNYVQFNDEFIKSNNNNDLFELDNFIQTQNKRFRKVKIDYNKYRDLSRLHLNVNLGSSDLNLYSKQKKIGNGSFGNVYKVISKQSGIVYAAKVSKYEIDICSDDTILNLSREIDIISSIYHPSILSFIGYCPKNFKSKQKPVIITEFAQNGSLEDVLQMERNGIGNHDWDDTKKLINIYGIAAGMAYLEKRSIIHRDLKPDNILLDEFLYPKIADFGMSKNISYENSINDKKQVKSGFKGTYAFSAPEIVKRNEYSDKGDVYSFAMIMYEIMTGEVPYYGFNHYKFVVEINNGNRPKFNNPIPYCYKNLIQRCWSENASLRPSFSKIRYILESDPNFITENVDKEEFLNYVGYMNEFQQSNIKNENFQFESHKNDSFKNIIVNSKLPKIEEKQDVINHDCFLDLTKYEKQKIIIKKDTIKIYQINEIETQSIFSAHISMNKINYINKEEIENLSNEIKIISQLNHPSLLKFVGFSLFDFKNERKPSIVTEFISNGTLEQVLELEKNNKIINGWDETKKLILIYGIASGMAYMHSYGIVHRSLEPSNIYLNDILFPKIGDFGLLTKFNKAENLTHQSITAEKGINIYTAPEALESNEFSKSSDVYSFAFIVFEVLSNEKPFEEIDKKNQIYKKIVIDGERPTIKESVPHGFQKLIQQCWSQDPNERPDFDDIVHCLKVDQDFLTKEINREDFMKYVKFVDSHTVYIESNHKIDEGGSEIINGNEEHEKEDDGKINEMDSNFILDEEEHVKISEEAADSLGTVQEKNINFEIEDEEDKENEEDKEEDDDEDKEDEEEKVDEEEKKDDEIEEEDEDKEDDEIEEDDEDKEDDEIEEDDEEKEDEEEKEDDEIKEDDEDKKDKKDKEDDEDKEDKEDDENDEEKGDEGNEEDKEEEDDDEKEDEGNEEDKEEEDDDEKEDEGNEEDKEEDDDDEKEGKENNEDKKEEKEFDKNHNFITEKQNAYDHSPSNSQEKFIKIDKEEGSLHPEQSKQQITNFIEENQEEANFSPEIFHNSPTSSLSKNHLAFINQLINSRDAQSLMNFLNANCDNETTSSVFDQVLREAPDLHANLLQAGIHTHNAVAHHKHAICLIFDPKQANYEEAIDHLKESIKLGFNFSHFSLSRLYYEVFKDEKECFKWAEEGFEKGEKYSKCLFGFYVARGIGTKKDLMKGASIILESEAIDFYENFSTEIGLFYSMKKKVDEKEVFKWFEKAFLLRKTTATINNYGVCYIKGIGVTRNISKAIEIFQIVIEKNDSNSMYHLAFLLEKTNPIESLKYYKLLAEKSDSISSFIFKDQNITKIIKAQENLALKYMKENDTENVIKYVFSLINEGCFDVPLRYATFLYKTKNFRQSLVIFDSLFKYNHPIAAYFIGVMKYKGEGCDVDKVESHKIMENLANKGIDKAVEFLEDFVF